MIIKKILCVVLPLVMLGGCAGQSEKAVSENVPIEKNDGAENQGDAFGGKDPAAEKEEEGTEKPDRSKDYDSCYDPVFYQIQKVIEDGYDDDAEYLYISNGLMEMVMYGEKDDLLNKIGYVMQDISGDDVPELLIGYDQKTDDEKKEESNVLSVFTLQEDKPVLVLDGWARNSYFWLGDGHFCNMGSNGVSNTGIGECRLSTDGSKIEWVDFYFTEEDAGGSLEYYHNTSGIWDAEQSERIRLSDEGFAELIDAYKGRVERLDWTPLGNSADEKTEEADSGDAADEQVRAGETGSSDTKLIGEWLYPNGAILEIKEGNRWSLYDDSTNWLFEGTWEAKPSADSVNVKLYSEVGDAGNGKVADGTLRDTAEYPSLEIRFVPGLTDFTDDPATLLRSSESR